MARSKSEVLQVLRDKAAKGAPADDLREQDIIAETSQSDLVLVRILQIVPFAGKQGFSVRYELWYSKADYEAGNYAPEDGSIPFTGYATDDEEAMIKLFKSKSLAPKT